MFSHYKNGDYIERIFPIEHKIKNTTDKVKSSPYLDLHPEIDNEGRLKTKLINKRDEYMFPNYEVFISM